MPRTRRDVTTPATALSRQRLNAQERHKRQPKQAQRESEARRPARDALGWPADLVSEIAGRLRAPQKRRGTILARMGPPLYGCSYAAAWPRTRGWAKHLPSRLRGAVPTRAWLTRLRQRGHDGRGALWRHIETRREATRRRWPWTWGLDDSVVRPARSPLAWGGPCWRGQPTRVVEGLAGVRLRVGLGAGTRVVPVAWAVRWPHPNGAGRRGRPTLGGAQGRLAQRLAAWRRRGLTRPAPLGVADRGGRDATGMAHGAHPPPGTCGVQGPAPSPFSLQEGRQGKGADVVPQEHAGPLRPRRHAPDWREARVGAKSPTAGAVTGLSVDKPSADRLSLGCGAPPLQATRLWRWWARCHWMAQVFRPWQPLWATDACPVHRADASDGHLV
jgi:hypothetical protein